MQLKIAFVLACNVLLRGLFFFSPFFLFFFVIDVGGQCLSTVILPVPNMTHLWDASMRYVKLIKKSHPLISADSVIVKSI
jgi:hypothetical protein